jgi:hypothetical protein
MWLAVMSRQWRAVFSITVRKRRLSGFKGEIRSVANAVQSFLIQPGTQFEQIKNLGFQLLVQRDS